MCLFIEVPQNEVDVNLEPGKHAVLLHYMVSSVPFFGEAYLLSPN